MASDLLFAHVNFVSFPKIVRISLDKQVVDVKVWFSFTVWYTNVASSAAVSRFLTAEICNKIFEDLYKKTASNTYV